MHVWRPCDGSSSTSLLFEKWPNDKIPKPPFAVKLVPIQAPDINSWGRKILGQKSWVVTEGTFNAWEDCIEANKDGEILMSGFTNIVNMVSYVCIGGDDAKHVQPKFIHQIEQDGIKRNKFDHYQTWNGSTFVDGDPAVITKGGYYWYKLRVQLKEGGLGGSFAVNRGTAGNHHDKFKTWAYIEES